MTGKIVVVGSVAWDEVVDLEQPLRSGAHNQGRGRGLRIGGGAANTAMALVRSGDEVTVISAVGDDAAGRGLIAALAHSGVDTARIDARAQETTRSVVLLENGGARTIVNLARARVPLPDRLYENDTDAVYVRSADPALTPLLRECLPHCLVVAHIPPTVAGARPAHILVGSRDDLDAAFTDDPWIAGLAVAGETLRWVVITHGGEGVVAYGAGTELRRAAPAVEVVDSTGAGDVFAAGLLHALVRGLPMESALETAVAWGAVSVSYEGTVPPEEFPALG